MIHSAFDISAASVALAMAVVLACVKMPDGEQWRAMRRMNSLLIACYSAMSISNVVTALCGVSTSADQVMCAAMLIVSMFQAMLFTAGHLRGVRLAAEDKRQMAHHQRSRHNAPRRRRRIHTMPRRLRL